MSKRKQKPGSHPARKGKQTQPSHSGDRVDKTVAGGSKSKVVLGAQGGGGHGSGGKERGETGGKRAKAEVIVSMIGWALAKFDRYNGPGRKNSDGDLAFESDADADRFIAWVENAVDETPDVSDDEEAPPPPQKDIARCSRDVPQGDGVQQKGGKSKVIDSKRTPPPGQARDTTSKKAIEQAVEGYHRTEWYSKAIKSGFKNLGALKRFNETVAAFQDQIDPLLVPVCMECGNSDVELCDHFVVAAKVAVDVEEDALVIVPAVNMKHRFQWVDKIRRMFTWPSFNSTLVQNHNLAGFRNEQIADTYIWPELFSYIRMGFNTTYVINGVNDRAAKLAHAKKLGVRFLDETKVSLADRNRPEFVNRFIHTVQRACDQRDDEMLLVETNPVHNFWVAPSTLLKVVGVGAVCGTIYFSPVLAAKLHVALLKPIHSFCGRLLTGSVVSLLLGSLQALKYLTRTVLEIGSATRSIMWSGSATHSSTGIQQLSCRIAPTMCTRVFTSGISSILPISQGNLLIGNDWKRSFTILQIGLLTGRMGLMATGSC